MLAGHAQHGVPARPTAPGHFQVAGPQRPLALQRGDGVDGDGAADRGGRRLRQPEVADLALLHQLGHRADRVLDRHPPVDPVLVVQVDHVDAQPAQAGLRAGADVLGAAVDDHRVATAGQRELGRQLHLVPPSGDRLADQLLVVPVPVDVGGVEEGDAEVQ